MNIVSKVAIVNCVVLFCNTFTVQAASYGTSLYSEDCYNWSNDNMSSEVFNDTQLRLNKAVLGQANIIFSEDHFDTCFGNIDTKAFESFKRYCNGLMPLAFSIAEWGSNGDLIYTFTPAIASKKLVNAGVEMSMLNPLQVNSEYYCSLGINSFGEKSYWGALQINKSYMKSSARYSCGYVPTDYYCWAEACQWTFHNKCELIKSIRKEEFEFKNEYEVLAHIAIAHNSGGNHLVSSSGSPDYNWYPWRSPQAVFNYVSLITSDSCLQIILTDADNYADSLSDKYRQGNVSGSLYKSISDVRSLLTHIGVNWSLVVKDKWVGNMTVNQPLAGDALRNWEKVCYPVQVIWNYRVLKRLYGVI